jgi:hypothetical protein
MCDMVHPAIMKGFDPLCGKFGGAQLVGDSNCPAMQTNVNPPASC